MSTISVWTGPAPRGGGHPTTTTFQAQSYHLTRAWGASPGAGIVEYVGDGPLTSPGCKLSVTAAGKVWWGVVKSDTHKIASDGQLRTLEFVDVREYLNWDYTFCSFNQRKDIIIDGVLRRRYVHILPKDFNAGLKLYTDQPFTADQIVGAILGFTKRRFPKTYSVETEWRNRSHVNMMLYPVFDLDFMGGRTLAAALTEIGEKLGLVFGLQDNQINPFALCWVRKGEGDLPTFDDGHGNRSVFPPNSDQRRLGSMFSEHPNKVRIVGGRNLYQVMDVPLIPDWLPAWQQFLDPMLFEQDIFNRGSEGGMRFFNTPNDPEQLSGRLRAAALAKTITVRGYAQLRAAVRLAGEAPVDADEWIDHRKWSGRMRADMPAELYMSALVFRAFRPADFSFPNYSGAYVPLLSMEILPRLVTRVSHDPVSGMMAAYPELPLDGAGYLIAQGYQIGQDSFRTLDPARFNVADWQGRQDLWQAITFSIDDTGEGIPFLLAEEPVIRSSDLLVKGDGSDYPILSANFTLHIPAVRACLVFAAEPFQAMRGRGSRLAAETVANLNGEFVTSANGGTGITEIPYADGQLADEKAQMVAEALLRKPFVYAEGGYRIQGIVGTPLSPMIDRVTIHITPSGFYEEVDFTAERRADRFVPERRYDRITREKFLMPGQEELREQGRALRREAAGFAAAGNQEFRGKLIEYLRGSQEPPVLITPDPAAVRVPAGTPVFRGADKKAAVLGQPMTDTVFVGVTAREGEVPSGQIPVLSVGRVFARVQGPVVANATVGRSATPGFGPLVTNSQTPVGQAMGTIKDSTVRTIPIRIGAVSAPPAAAVTGVPFEVTSAGPGQVQVSPASYLLQSLSATDILPIGGLGVPFEVQDNDLIWLEVWFDFNSPAGLGGNPYAVNLAHGQVKPSTLDDQGSWTGAVLPWSCWPRLVQVVRPKGVGSTPADTVPDDAALAAVIAGWVGVADPFAKVLVLKEHMQFPVSSLVKQWRAFVLIAVMGSGGKVAAQCLRTHLQLAWFVESGVPVQYLIPCGAPYVAGPTVVGLVDESDMVVLSTPGWPDAIIRFRIVAPDDVSLPTIDLMDSVYAGPFDLPNLASKLQAIGQMAGFPDGPVMELPL